MSIGIGLAFAAMPNLIVDAVPPEETGEATGVNALVRSVGSVAGLAGLRRGPRRQRRRRRGPADRRRLHRGFPRQRRRRARSPRSPRSSSPAAGAACAAACPPHQRGDDRDVAARTRADAVRNRERVVAAAAEVFAEKGDGRRACPRSPRAPASARAPSTAASRPRTTSSRRSRSERVRWFEREARAAAAADDPWAAFGAFHGGVAEAHCRDRGMVASMSQGIELPELVEARAAAHDACARADGPRDRPGRDARRRRSADLKILLGGIARSLRRRPGARPRLAPLREFVVARPA